MQPDLLIALTAARALDTTFHVPGTSRPQWTAAEAAQACQGMPDHVFAAMLYSYAGATEMYFRLQSSLIAYGTATARELEVGQRVKRDGKKRPYIADLCGLFLIEERQPWRFIRKSNEPNLRRVLMDIDEQTWRRKVSPVYESVRAEYIDWLDIGRMRMRRWLRSEVASKAQ